MAQIKVSFRTILSNINLTVLIRAHGPGVNIEIGIKFKDGDTEPAGFKNSSQGCSGNTLTQRRNNTTSYKNKTRHSDPVQIRN